MSRAAAVVLLAALAAGAVMACGSQAASASALAERASVRLRIEGMACDSCAARLAKELRDVNGVLEVEVAFAETRARVAYDAKRLTPQRLVAAVKEIGFEATVERAAD